MDRTEIRGDRIELELESSKTSPIRMVISQKGDGSTSVHISQDGEDEIFVVPNAWEFSLIGEPGSSGKVQGRKVVWEDKLGPVLGDNKKLRVDLVPMEAIEAIAEVMEWSGTKKYEDWDWLTKYTVMDCWASAMRHMIKWKKWGDDNDPESGINHLYHALTRLGMAAYFLKKIGGDEALPNFPPKRPHGE